MITTQPPRVQSVVNLVQLNLGNACDIFTPRVQSKEIHDIWCKRLPTGIKIAPDVFQKVMSKLCLKYGIYQEKYAILMTC
jgi:hypothetical protein